jgi:tetratricopeptide (TPR) repeat protein
MTRMMRDRGSVGRRIWRRRKRKLPVGGPVQIGAPAASVVGTLAGSAETALGAFAGGFAMAADGDGDPSPPPAGPKGERGFFARLFGKKPPSEPSYLQVDPVAEVLAVPRGVARLDAFEQALANAAQDTPAVRAVAVAFQQELIVLADTAGVDLSLLESRVAACARALVAAGEDERAGALLLRAGRRHQATERFVAAGAIDALEEVYAQIHWDEGGVKHDARLAYERFEALFLVGQRAAALEALEKAHRLWHDNPVYAEVRAVFLKRLGSPHRLSLIAGREALNLHGRFPVVVGRGEEAHLRLASPLLSRAHLRIALRAGAPSVADLESRGGTVVDEQALSGERALAESGTIDMGGVVLRYARRAEGLVLWPAVLPDERTVVALAAEIRVPDREGGEIAVRFDEGGRAVLLDGRLNGERLARPTLVLAGDRIGGWTVRLSDQR